MMRARNTPILRGGHREPESFRQLGAVVRDLLATSDSEFPAMRAGAGACVSAEKQKAGSTPIDPAHMCPYRPRKGRQQHGTCIGYRSAASSTACARR